MEQALSKQFADAVLSFVRDAELASAHVVTSDGRHELVAAGVAIAMISGTLDDLECVAIVVNDRAFDVAPRFVGGHSSAAID